MTQLNNLLLYKAKKYTDELDRKHKVVLEIDSNLTRQLVSFQANKQNPIYRWYKYKEAFSAKLVDYLFDKYSINCGKILDPFAGAGTAIFAASMRGNDSFGIELLPIGQEIIKTRQCIEESNIHSILHELKKWLDQKPWEYTKEKKDINVLRITRGAYPEKTENDIKKFLWAIDQLEDKNVKQVLFFALLCIAESISFTRKDGQYLRWDSRSKRTNGKRDFNKGYIPDFGKALAKKLDEIIKDISKENEQLELFDKPDSKPTGKTFLYCGSCLVELPKIKANTFSAIITSPPYCNRYDYTRTYALELAFLGIDEMQLRNLRQTMLTCTVENKEKDLLSLNPRWQGVLKIVESQQLLHAILEYLDNMRVNDKLNNDGIIRMIKGYFYEMTCVINECYRVLRKNGLMIMVNDNVKYAGIGIPVDLILSDLAEKIGFTVKSILVLPQGKGNSSQQMGIHGREVLRKCVYVWTKE
ncbi:MAG: site-specific DNA-methyltransferase [Candidatus Brocadiales bacterium]